MPRRLERGEHQAALMTIGPMWSASAPSRRYPKSDRARALSYLNSYILHSLDVAQNRAWPHEHFVFIGGIFVSIERTRETITAFLRDLFLRGSYGRYFAADVTFATLRTGQIAAGPIAVERLIRHYCEEIFDTHLRVTMVVVDVGRATLSLDFAGIHKGEFLGVAATGRSISVPCDVDFELREGEIVAMRGHVSKELLLEQLGAS